MNLHYLYYKKYFENGLAVNSKKWVHVFDLDKDGKFKEDAIQIISERNKMLRTAPLSIIEPNPLVNTPIKLTIAYPGLVTGVGISHEAGIEGEYKLGVHFDYTWGMPIVYGSSVKGLLRSVFPCVNDSEQKKDCKVAYIKEIMGSRFVHLSVEMIEKMRDAIFEGMIDGKSKSIYQRDIFFDAVITKASEKNKILESDSITPHKDPLKNPNPIAFLKIAPGVMMEFRFKLEKAIIDGVEVDVLDKKRLFEQILKDLGVGAKTNVGYGQFK